MLRKFVVYNLILVEHAEEKADLREVIESESWNIFLNA